MTEKKVLDINSPMSITAMAWPICVAYMFLLFLPGLVGGFMDTLGFTGEQAGYTASSHLGGMMVALGRVDAIVFTGGIGEKGANIRAAVCADLQGWGIVMDAGANQAVALKLAPSATDSNVTMAPGQAGSGASWWQWLIAGSIVVAGLLVVADAGDETAASQTTN